MIVWKLYERNQRLKTMTRTIQKRECGNTTTAPDVKTTTKPDQKVLHGYTTAPAAALASGLDRCRTEDAGINLKEFQAKHTCAASDCSGPSFDGVMKNM
jgi:hypothetical protein